MPPMRSRYPIINGTTRAASNRAREERCSIHRAEFQISPRCDYNGVDRHLLGENMLYMSLCRGVTL